MFLEPFLTPILETLTGTWTPNSLGFLILICLSIYVKIYLLVRKISGFVGIPQAVFTHRPHRVPFWGSCLESFAIIPKRNYYGASG